MTVLFFTQNAWLEWNCVSNMHGYNGFVAKSMVRMDFCFQNIIMCLACQHPRWMSSSDEAGVGSQGAL